MDQSDVSVIYWSSSGSSARHWEKRGFPEEEITIVFTASEQVGKKMKQRRECDRERSVSPMANMFGAGSFHQDSCGEGNQRTSI